MAKIERSFEVCPIFEFYVYYAEFMVISVSLGSCGGHFHPTALKRLSWEFCTKNFWSHTAGGAFDNQVFFIRGTCLQLGTLSPGISYRSGGTPSWAKLSFENQQLDWDERTIVRVTRKLLQHNVLRSYWWRRGRHIVERTGRGAVVCKCYAGCFLVFIQTYNYVVDFCCCEVTFMTLVMKAK